MSTCDDWVLLASIAIYRLVEHRLARAIAIALPVLMLSAIVLTANHYLMDAIVGGGIVLAGLGVATALERRPTERTVADWAAH